MRNVKVSLVEYEALQSGLPGLIRGIRARFRGYKNVNNTWTDERFARVPFWEKTIESSFAELAAAKALGTYYAGTLGTFKDKPDIAPDIEVRLRTPYAKHHDLIVRKTDNPKQKVVLVTGELPNYIVVGWIGVEEAWQHEDWYEERGGMGAVYWVPEDALHDLDELIVSRPAVETDEERFDRELEGLFDD